MADQLASLSAVPLTADQARARAAGLKLAIPDACMEGVLVNLALLARHTDQLFAGKPPS